MFGRVIGKNSNILLNATIFLGLLFYLSTFLLKMYSVTGEAIPIGDGRNHFDAVCGEMTVVDGHRHDFLFKTEMDASLV